MSGYFSLTKTMKKYIVLSVLILLPYCLHAQNLITDSLPAPEFRQYAGYIGIGFPYGLSAEAIYRPFNSMAFSLGANMAIPILYLIEGGRPSVSAGFYFPTSRIKSSGVQDGIYTSMTILTAFGFDPAIYTLTFTFGSMGGSLPLVNWKFGAMLFLRESGSTFLRRIMGFPILSISLRLL